MERFGALSANPWCPLTPGFFPVRELDRVPGPDKFERLCQLTWPFLAKFFYPSGFASLFGRACRMRNRRRKLYLPFVCIWANCAHVGAAVLTGRFLLLISRSAYNCFKFQGFGKLFILGQFHHGGIGNQRTRIPVIFINNRWNADVRPARAAGRR